MGSKIFPPISLSKYAIQFISGQINIPASTIIVAGGCNVTMPGPALNYFL